MTYLIIFVIINAAKWGINVEFTGDEQQMFYVSGKKVLFIVLFIVLFTSQRSDS